MTTPKDALAEDCKSCGKDAGRYNVCWYCEAPTCVDCTSEAQAWNGDSHEQVGLCPKCMDDDVPARIDWLGIQTFQRKQAAIAECEGESEA